MAEGALRSLQRGEPWPGHRLRAAQGPQPIPTLHLCRCGSKKVVRLLVRLEESGVRFDPILYRFANLLANFFFVLTVYLKQAWDVTEVPYVSINY